MKIVAVEVQCQKMNLGQLSMWVISDHRYAAHVCPRGKKGVGGVMTGYLGWCVFLSDYTDRS